MQFEQLAREVTGTASVVKKDRVEGRTRLLVWQRLCRRVRI